MYAKFGQGRAMNDAAHEVRDGHISREEAVALVRKGGRVNFFGGCPGGTSVSLSTGFVDYDPYYPVVQRRIWPSTYCVPARYVTGYLGDIGIHPDSTAMDFSAWMEVYLSGAWRTVDAASSRSMAARPSSCASVTAW